MNVIYLYCIVLGRAGVNRLHFRHRENFFHPMKKLKTIESSLESITELLRRLKGFWF